MLSQLRKGNPQIILFFIIFSIVFLVIPLISNSFFDSGKKDYLIFVFILTLFLPIFHAIILNNLIYDKDIIKKHNFILAPVFILCSTFFFKVSEFWIYSFILIFFFNFLLGSYQKKYPFSSFFNSGFVIGGLSLLYPNIIFYYPLIIIVGIVFENLSWRVFMASILGLFTPFLFYFFWIFCAETPFLLTGFLIDQNLFSTILERDWGFSGLMPILVIGFIFFVSIIELFGWLYKKSIRSRKSFIILLFYLILTIIIVFLNNSNKDSFYLLLTPISIIFTNYFIYCKKKRLIDFLFLCLLMSSIYYRYKLII